MLLMIILPFFGVALSANIGHQILDRSQYNEERIVGGDEAARHSKPWMALIKMLNKDKEIALCGGVLISENWVLTAAHCFLTNHFDRAVYFGINNWCNGDMGPTIKKRIGQRRKIKKIVYHPRYSVYNPVRWDIALLQLRSPVTPKMGNISFAKLPERNPKVEEMLQVSGWGYTEETSTKYECKLRTVNVPVVSSSMCESVEPDLQAQFCAGSLEGGKDACQGDSGGPMVDIVQPGFDVTVYGIVSFGDGCGEPMKPGVYTDVYSYVQWIKQTISP